MSRDPRIATVAREVTADYRDNKRCPKTFSDFHFKDILRITMRRNSAGPGLYEECKRAAEAKLLAALEKDARERKEKQQTNEAAKEKSHALPPLPKKRRLKPSSDTISGSFF